MVLRTGTDGDAAAAAALHAGQISEGFLTFLGPRFLRRLYRRVARTPGCFLLVVENDGTMVGFLAGSTDVSALYRSFVWRDGVAAAFASGGRLLRSWRRVIETLRHGTGGAGEGTELLAVAVDPTARGRGAGTLLVEGFLNEVRGEAAAGGPRSRRSGQRRPRSRCTSEPASTRSSASSCIREPSRCSCSGRLARHRVVTVEVLIVATAALVVTAALVPVCIVVARRWDILDRPGALKTQETPVPYLGGVAVFSGVAVGACVGRPIVLVPLAAALAVGVGDDRFDLPAPLRLGAQLGVGARHRCHPAGPPTGLDRRTTRHGGQRRPDQRLQFARRPRHAGRRRRGGGCRRLRGPHCLVPLVSMAASLTAALVAFVWYNRPPARIYLGDGGSYLIGASMTVLLAYAWGVGTPAATGVIALALLVVPVAEVACAIVRRRRGGRSLLSGDRAHPYDLLVASGWSRTAASATYIAVEVAVVDDGGGARPCLHGRGRGDRSGGRGSRARRRRPCRRIEQSRRRPRRDSSVPVPT